MDEAKREDRNVELDRVDARMKLSLAHTALEKVAHRVDEWQGRLGHERGLLHVSAPQQILVPYQLDELRMIEEVVEREIDQRQHALHRLMVAQVERRFL